ncbi:hypothetical protein [Chryseobacterium gallinarum]|nr:hypothetical protein [Chryseobacterium gallinarum]
MKSLKEFIAENLESPTVPTVQESTEKEVDENDNQQPTVQEGENKETEEK